MHIPSQWMQGRTTYGGLSAALCLQVVHKEYDVLPPLRSALINFIGPTGGDVVIQTKVLRRGKSVAYISSEIIGEQGLATHAVFCFGAARQSKIDEVFGSKPDVQSVKRSKQFLGFKSAPTFTQNFECLLAKGSVPVPGSYNIESYMWAHHKEPEANDLAALLAVG